MKKFLFIVLSVLLLAFFIGCEDDGILEVSIEDDNSDSQFNVNFDGDTLTITIPRNTVTKVTTTATGDTEETIPLEERTRTISFDDGTFTMVETDTATAAADAAYVDGGGITYTPTGFDNTGFTGVVFNTITGTGTYEVLKGDDGVKTYLMTLDSVTEVSNDASGGVPTTTATYTATTTTTDVFNFIDEIEFIGPGNPNNEFYDLDGAVYFELFMDTGGFSFPGDNIYEYE